MSDRFSGHHLRMTAKRATVPLTARAVASAVAGAILVAGCGGGSASGGKSGRPPAAPAPPPTPSVPAPAPAPPTPSSVAGPGSRSFGAVSSCLRQHDVPTTVYAPPAGVTVEKSTPKILLAMPWNAVQITIYDTPHAGTSSVTLANGGAVMSRGNVSMALDEIPEPPAPTMRTIEACALG
jgi:hypothetical protein